MTEPSPDEWVFRRSDEPVPTQLEQQEWQAAEAARDAGWEVERVDVPEGLRRQVGDA